MKLPCVAAICVLAFAVGVLLNPGPLRAEDVVLSDAEKAKFTENILLPSPGEVFLALQRAGNDKADWIGAASFCPTYDYDNDYLRALNLGLRAADGFLAIQAKDKARLGDMIRVILTLAEELMVEQTILDKGRVFEDLARRDEWKRLHQELDVLRDQVQQEMERLGDQDVALLVSAGGWLEGLRATAKVIEGNYQPPASSILYQPRLVAYFQDKMTQMSPRAQAVPQVRAIIEALPEIMALIDVGYRQPVPEENVRKLLDLSAKLVLATERG